MLLPACLPKAGLPSVFLCTPCCNLPALMESQCMCCPLKRGCRRGLILSVFKRQGHRHAMCVNENCLFVSAGLQALLLCPVSNSCRVGSPVEQCVEGGRMMNVWKSNADSMMLLTIYELFNSDGPLIVAVAHHVRLAQELNKYTYRWFLKFCLRAGHLCNT